jgi:predicted nucleotidyltransferase
MVQDVLLREVVRRALLVVPGVQRIVLFGSRARGTARPDSDVDLVIITPTVPAHGPRTVALRLALRGLDVGFDLIVLTPEEWQVLSAQPGTVAAAADLEGQVLHEAA